MINIGLILSKDFHEKDKWNCPLSYYFVEELKRQFSCIWIEDQNDYNNNINKVNALLHISPGFSSPTIDYHSHEHLKSFMILSDFHSEQWRQEYFIKNNIRYLLTFYPSPAKYHFSDIPQSKIIDYYWAVPNNLLANKVVNNNQDYLMIFGATNHEAYETRQWCKQFDFVKSFDNSGVENKVYTKEMYFDFLYKHDAIIASGSLQDKYKMLLPKYFEILSVGALLFAQYNDDLIFAGFKDGVNCIIFNKDNFEQKAKHYLANKNEYIGIRKNGIELIRERHTTEQRVREFKNMFWEGG